MFVESFTLKKNSWHMGMMRYIWDLGPRDFSHICPYFWLSILNLIIIIPVSVAKLIGGLFGAMFSDIRAGADRREMKRMHNLYEQLRNDPEAQKRFAASCKKDFNQFDMFIWGRDNSLAKQLESDRHEWKMTKWANEKRSEDESKQRAIFRKARINDILKYTKPVIMGVAWTLATVALLFATYWIYRFFAWVINVPAKEWYNLGMFLALCIVIVLIIIAIVIILKKSIEALACAMSDKTPVWLVWMWKPFKWLFKGLGLLIAVMFEIAKNNCPSIDWE